MKYRKKHFKIQKIKNKFRQNQLKLVFYFFFKIIIFLIILLTLQKTFKLKKIKKNSFEMKKNALKDEYFACFCTMGKQENLYSRELIEYYLKIGFGKFIFGDNNSPNTEKLSDVLQDYISNNIVDIIEIFGSPMSQSEFFTIVYNKYNKFCKWISFFDFDEYLEMHNEPGKNIDLKKYLSNPSFDKCESIGFNWLICPDNNLFGIEPESKRITGKKKKITNPICFEFDLSNFPLNKCEIFFLIKAQHAHNKDYYFIGNLEKMKYELEIE